MKHLPECSLLDGSLDIGSLDTSMDAELRAVEVHVKQALASDNILLYGYDEETFNKQYTAACREAGVRVRDKPLECELENSGWFILGCFEDNRLWAKGPYVFSLNDSAPDAIYVGVLEIIGNNDHAAKG